MFQQMLHQNVKKLGFLLLLQYACSNSVQTLHDSAPGGSYDLSQGRTFDSFSMLQLGGVPEFACVRLDEPS